MIDGKTVSIVMPVHNVWEYTSKCIDSLLKTDTQFDKFYLIDNASTDQTKTAYFEQRKKDPRFEVIENNINVGVARSWNQGVKRAGGDYVCIMNNDILVTKGWLTEMFKAAEENNKKVIIPQSTQGELPEGFPTPPKTKVDPYYIGKLKKGIAKGVHFQAYCIMVHASVFTNIGYFDEQFEMWWYEDGDFLERLVQLADQNEDDSYKPTMALNAYVHHFGSKTLEKFPEDVRMRYIETNKKRYEQKHHKSIG